MLAVQRCSEQRRIRAVGSETGGPGSREPAPSWRRAQRRGAIEEAWSGWRRRPVHGRATALGVDDLPPWPKECSHEHRSGRKNQTPGTTAGVHRIRCRARSPVGGRLRLRRPPAVGSCFDSDCLRAPESSLHESRTQPRIHAAVVEFGQVARASGYALEFAVLASAVGVCISGCAGVRVLPGAVAVAGDDHVGRAGL